MFVPCAFRCATSMMCVWRKTVVVWEMVCFRTRRLSPTCSYTHSTLSPPLPSTGCALQPPVGERRDPLLESETRKYATMFQTLLMQVGDNP